MEIIKEMLLPIILLVIGLVCAIYFGKRLMQMVDDAKKNHNEK